MKEIEQAKEQIKKGDYHLANYILRDLSVVKEDKELSDYSWGLHQEGNPSKADVEMLIEMIEEKLDVTK